jgi:predicted peptidase
MHDGQNCMDPATSFIGVDWAVDEALVQLAAQGSIRLPLVVLVWNTAARLQEYMPAGGRAWPLVLLVAVSTDTQGNAMIPLPIATLAGPLQWLMQQQQCWYDMVQPQYYNPTSDLYLEMLVKEVKPFVDQRYRTLPGQQDTFLMGSSMGGLISLYALQRYPEVRDHSAGCEVQWAS